MKNIYLRTILVTLISILALPAFSANNNTRLYVTKPFNVTGNDGNKFELQQVQLIGLMDSESYAAFVSHFDSNEITITDEFVRGRKGKGAADVPGRSASITRTLTVKDLNGVETIAISLTQDGTRRSTKDELLFDTRKYSRAYIYFNLENVNRRYSSGADVKFSNSLSKIIGESFVFSTGLRSSGYVDHFINCENGLCSARLRDSFSGL